MHANQGNNFYVFPGLGLGSILVGSDHISDGMLNAAAEAIPRSSPRRRWRAANLPSHQPDSYISVKVASAVMRQAVNEGREGRGGKIREIIKLDGQEGIEQHVRSSMYYPEYRPTVFAPGGGKGTAD